MTFAAARVAHGVIARRALRIGNALPVLESHTHAGIAGVANETSRLIVKPTGTAENDLLLCLVSLDGNGSLITFTPPADAVPWIELEQGGSPNQLVFAGAWYKVAGAAEPSDYTWTWDQSQSIGMWMGRLSGFDTVNPINARSWRSRDTAVGGTTDQDTFIDAITTDITKTLLIHSLMVGGGSGLPSTPFISAPPDTTQSRNDTHGGTQGTGHCIATEPFLGGGGTGNRTWVIDDANVGNRPRINQFIAIAPVEGVASKLELEATTDNILLEDGSGILLLE